METHKVITIPSNFNNKLACPIMQHIDLAPWTVVPESLMEKTIIEFRTADDSHPPTFWKLFDLMRLGSEQLVCALTFPSHGMDACDFYKYLVKQYAAAKDISKLAIYFYKKISATDQL